MNVRRTSPVAILAVLLSASGFCKDTEPAEAKPEFVVESWGGDQGLPQNSVIAIFQSTDGYFWLGTYSSITRFDGVRFTTFDPGVTPGLSGNRILAICEDRDGTLWMTTENDGIVAYRH